MIKKIVFTGAESTGKSYFSSATALLLKEPLVSEYAVYYLNWIRRHYNYDDIAKILEGQLRWENYFLKRASKLLVCDTDPLVLFVWSMDKFGKVDSKIINHLENDSYHKRFLCSPDIPWENANFREDRGRRDLLHEKYIETCEKYNLNFTLLKGSLENKMKKIKNEISEMRWD